MMKYNIIATGSAGNAVVINNHILIDCGVSYRALEAVRQGLRLVLLTHIHSDHFKPQTIGRLAKERPSLRFACCRWLVPPLLAAGVSKTKLDILEIGKLYDYGEFSAAPVQLYHDVPNCGWRIFMNGEKLFYATDTNTLEGITAKDYDLYMIEANYEEEEIRERIRAKRESGQYPYELGVLRTHLSRRKCDDFIYSNIGKRGSYVYLHQHTERTETEKNHEQGNFSRSADA